MEMESTPKDGLLPKRSDSFFERWEKVKLHHQETNAMSLEVRLTYRELKGMKKALDEIEKAKEEVVEEGLSQFTFFIGIINTVVTAYLFGKYPQHLWLFYAIETSLFIPAWVVKMSRDLNGFCMVFDFCWITSTCFGAYMWCLYFGVLPEDWRRCLFLIFFSCSLGPMSWFLIVLMAGLIFHSLDKTASLFIHFTPVLVTYVVRYYPEVLAESWPGLFPTPSELTVESLATYDPSPFPRFFFYIDKVYLHGWYWYAFWWICMTLFLVTCGVDLPPRHNTVFGNIYDRAGLGPILESKTGLKSIRSHAVIYMIVHGLASSFSFFWAPGAFYSGSWLGGFIAGSIGGVMCGIKVGAPLKGLIIMAAIFTPVGYFMSSHATWIMLVFVSVVFNGAAHYDEIFAQKYTKVLQTLLHESHLDPHQIHGASP